MRASTLGSLFGSLILAAALPVSCTELSPDANKARHLERGVAYFEKGQYPEAAIEFKNVVQIDPRDVEGHYRLALTYLKLGDLPDLQGAFSELTKTVELDPQHRDAQLRLGELYLLAKEPLKARQRADIVLASAPDDPRGLLLRGRSLIGKTPFRKASAT